MTIVIRSEDDAWQTLESTLRDQIQLPKDEWLIRFKDWPTIEYRFEGERWRSSVPTRVMPAILDAQRDLYRAYARIRYGTDDARRLTDEERETLEIVVTIGEGSSKFTTALENAMNYLVEGALAKMGPRELVVTIIGVSLVVGSNFAWKDWLRYKQQAHDIDARVALSKEETRRLELLTEARKVQPTVQAAYQDTLQSRSQLLRSLDDQDQFQSSGIQIPGNEAAQLARAPRETAQDVRVDGVFRILGVTDRGSSFRLQVRRMEDGSEMAVDAHDAVLSHDMRTALKEGQWTRRPVYLAINARLLHGRYTSAAVVHAELLTTDSDQAQTDGS